ncbi:unnamed protein product, partial [Ectocarpus sp. 6 AP-2014]
GLVAAYRQNGQQALSRYTMRRYIHTCPFGRVPTAETNVLESRYSRWRWVGTYSHREIGRAAVPHSAAPPLRYLLSQWRYGSPNIGTLSCGSKSVSLDRFERG